MQQIKLSIAIGTLTLSLLFGVPLLEQARAQEPRDRAADANQSAGLSPDSFEKLRALIKPRPGGFDDIAWLTDLSEARKQAAEEGKPLLVWVGDGHPLGWT